MKSLKKIGVFVLALIGMFQSICYADVIAGPSYEEENSIWKIVGIGLVIIALIAICLLATSNNKKNNTNEAEINNDKGEEN